jgi:hypothetical protein
VVDTSSSHAPKRDFLSLARLTPPNPPLGLCLNFAIVLPTREQ